MKKIGFEERASIILADIITRIIYGVAAFILTVSSSYSRTSPGGTPRNINSVASEEGFYGVLLMGCICALLSAAFGPAIYKKIAHRGRGTLEEVKKASRGKHQGYRKR